MNIAKEIVLNKLITIPLIRKWARKVNNRTGMNGDAETVAQTYGLYTRFADVKGKAVLELGPGHTWQCVEMALQNGAVSADIADIELQIPKDVLDKSAFKFTLYNGTKLPYANESFDLVWSHTVYEHLRHPSTTVAETWRVLRPGGIAVHWIDLRDHFVLDNDNPNVFNMLQYKEDTWKRMTWNRSTYVNRLRYSQWINLHEASQFNVLHTEKEVSRAIGGEMAQGRLAYLNRYSNEDATTAQMLLVAQKRQR
jgi:ubiquinone/menaquinone biosynthesis C-methylase UbiE